MSVQQQNNFSVQRIGEKIEIDFKNKTINSLLAINKIVSFEQAFPLALKFNHPASQRLSQYYYVTYDSTSADTFSLLKNAGFFESVERIGKPKILFTPTDYSLQGSLSTLALNKINAQSAWDVTTGSSSVIIAIVDNGFDVTHPDIINQIIYQDGDVSYPGQSHGLPVAGLVAAQTDNGIGVSSIGFNVWRAAGAIYSFWTGKDTV